MCDGRIFLFYKRRGLDGAQGGERSDLKPFLLVILQIIQTRNLLKVNDILRRNNLILHRRNQVCCACHDFCRASKLEEQIARLTDGLRGQILKLR